MIDFDSPEFSGNDFSEKILAKCFEVPHRDLLRDVMSYNDSMTISQVIKFFERQGVLFTKPMIQHYVRIGVIPPPEDKRRYSRMHLLMLAILEQLKGVCALEDIAVAFSGLTSSDETISQFQSLAVLAVEAWRGTLGRLVNKAAEAANGVGLDEPEAQRLFESFVMLGIMAQGAVAKQTALHIGGQMDNGGGID